MWCERLSLVLTLARDAQSWEGVTIEGNHGDFGLHLTGLLRVHNLILILILIPILSLILILSRQGPSLDCFRNLSMLTKLYLEPDKPAMSFSLKDASGDKVSLTMSRPSTRIGPSHPGVGATESSATADPPHHQELQAICVQH